MSGIQDKMAARCQATYSSTPASLIYAQSWPVPSSLSLVRRYPGKPASNSPGKSLNSSWIYKAKKQNTTPQQATSSTDKSRSWASSMLNTQYPEWIEDDSLIKLDMAQEFKLTLQMFKKLTQQVKEVDEQLNSCRKPYLFRHYFTNKDNPGIHRSQLAANMRSFSPEVPMTNQACQPCNNFRLTREKQRPHSHLGINRKNDKSLNSIFPKPKAEAWSSTIPVTKSKSNMNQSEECKSLDIQKYQETPLNEECLKIQSCKDFSWSSSADLNSEEDVGFGYIDPVPDDWDKKKLEELEQECFADKKEKQDPFLKRYLELCRLQTETLENERRNPKMEESVENVSGLNFGSEKTNGNGSSQGKKLCGSKMPSPRTNDEKIKGSGFKSNLSDSKYSKSCVSKYVEGKMEKKLADVKEKKPTKRNKSARNRKKVSSSTNSYRSSSVAQYDIVELASSFDPPSKDRINSKSRPVTAKSAKSKGLLPGKSWYSQRRFSLTSVQACLDVAPDNNDLVPVPFNKPTSTTKSHQKSTKKKKKRCSSSKQF